MDVNKVKQNKEITTQSIIEKYSNVYSKEEFKYVIGVLPHKELVIPFLKKDYKKDIEKFRAPYDKVPIFTIFSIYYNKIIHENNIDLARYLDNIIDNFLTNIDKKITASIQKSEDVREKIKNDDEGIFEKVILLLIGYGFKENPFIYFKMINYNLSNKQKIYIETNFKSLVKIYNTKIHLQNNFEYKIKIMQKNKDKEIKDLNKLLKVLEKEKDNIMSESKSKIFQLKEEYNNRILKFDQEIKKNIEIVENLKLKLSVEKHNMDILKQKNKDISSEIYKQANIFIEEKKNFITIEDKLKIEIDILREKLSQTTTAINLRYSEYNKVANEKWIKLNRELMDKHNTLIIQIDDLELKKLEFESTINLLNNKKNEIEDSILEIQKSKNELIDIIKNTSTQNRESKQSNSKIYRISSKKVQCDEDIIFNKVDFIYDLAQNLENSGVSDKFSYDLAQYIYGVFSNKMPLLLIGYNSRKIADAMSHVICASTAEIIIPPLGYTDTNELISVVNNIENKVIAIENTIESLSENLYIPLIKQNQDKFLVFCMESTDNFALLPKTIFNYMGIVDLDILLNFEKDGEFLSSCTDAKVFEHEKNTAIIKRNTNKINHISENIKLNKVVKNQLAQIMGIIDGIDKSNSLSDIIVFELITIFRDSVKLEFLKDLILEQGFNSNVEKNLLSLIGEEIVDG